MGALDKIKTAIDHITDKEPLFTNLAANLKIVEATDCPTMGTDGEHLLYNPEFVDKLSADELCGVILHEVLHCSFLHIWRRGKRDAMKWNIAADYAINTVVNENFPLPKGCLLDMKYYGMSAEEIYDSLPDQKQKQGQGKSGKGKGSGGQGKLKEQAWGDHSKWTGQQDRKNKKGKGKGEGTILDKLLGKKPAPKPSKSEGELENQWRELFDQQIVKQYGRLPETLKRFVEKNFYVPVIDWASLVASILSEDTTDYTFSQPDRRFLNSDFMLPDLFTYDNVKDVVFAYDTSGSISQEDLQAFHGETLSLLDNFSSLTGWSAVCDAWLHSFEEMSPRITFEGMRFVGGGGTDFRPVFKEIEKRGIRPKALFYFTDTYGEFPSEPPAYPVFWLVRSQISYAAPEFSVPFGQVIPFMS